jgi:hypothetical membrane protein
METLNFIANISGLISCIVVPIILRICWKQNQYDVKKNTLSDCGGFPFTARLFTFGLAMFGILEVTFTYTITKNLLPPHQMWITIPAFIGGIFTAMVAVFDNRRFPKLHEVFSYAAFVLLLLWCFGLHILIYQAHGFIGVVGLGISVILSTLVGITSLKYGACAIPEIIFIVGVMIWNLFFSYVILWG